MGGEPGILQVLPDLESLTLLEGHRGVLDNFGKKLDEKLKHFRGPDILFSAKQTDWQKLSELAQEIRVNNQCLVVLTEGLTEMTLRAAASSLDLSPLLGSEFGVKIVSSSLGTDALGRLARDLEGQRVSLMVAFYSDPSPRLLWCYRLLFSHLASDREPEELRRRVFLAAGEKTSEWGLWAQKSGFRHLTFPDHCAGRYLFFSEPVALLFYLREIQAWHCIEGGRSYFRQSEKKAGLSDPLLAYCALREVKISEGCCETLMITDEMFLDFSEWWRLMGEDSRREFSEGIGRVQVCRGSVMVERQSRGLKPWATTLRIDGDTMLQVDELEKDSLDPWPSASKRHWAPLEQHYEQALEQKGETTSPGQPGVCLRLRRLDPMSVGALFAFFEGVSSVSQRLADLGDQWNLLTARSIAETTA